MTIEELITELEKIKEEHGNIEVKVQYRDDGGFYCGSDEEILLSVEKDHDDEEYDEEEYVLL